MIPWLLSNALTAAALALLAGLIIWAARPGPAVRHALWLVVLFKLVSPGGFVWSVPLPFDAPQVAVSSSPKPDPVTPYVPIDRSPVIVDEEIFTVLLDEQTGRPVMDETDEIAAEASSLDRPTEAQPPTPVAPTISPPNYAALAFGLWCVGAALIGGRQSRDTWRFHRFVRQSSPAPDWLVAEVAVVANRLYSVQRS